MCCTSLSVQAQHVLYFYPNTPLCHVRTWKNAQVFDAFALTLTSSNSVTAARIDPSLSVPNAAEIITAVNKKRGW
jgi:hypothetical protein